MMYNNNTNIMKDMFTPKINEFEPILFKIKNSDKNLTKVQFSHYDNI